MKKESKNKKCKKEQLILIIAMVVLVVIVIVVIAVTSTKKPENMLVQENVSTTIEANVQESPDVNQEEKKLGKEQKDTSKGKKTPFDELEVVFAGIAPYGSATIHITEDSTYIKETDFLIENATNLENGEKVRVVFTGDVSLLPKEYKLSQKEAEYEVSGLFEYVTTSEQFTDEFWEKVKADSVKQITTYAENEYVGSANMGELSYVGYVYHHQKPESEHSGVENLLFVIYSCLITDSADSFEDSIVYYPVLYQDIMMRDGKVSYTHSSGICGSDYLNQSWEHTKGYVNPLEMYEDLVAGYEENYVLEQNEGFEKYDDDGLLSGLSDISAEYKAFLEAHAREVLDLAMQEKIKDPYHIEDITHFGECLLLAKTPSEYVKQNNQYTVVFRGTIISDANEFEPITVYLPVLYRGLLKLPDEHYLYSDCWGLQGSSWLEDVWYWVIGFTDTADMFWELVKNNEYGYTYEMSESLKQLAE